jgi:hypothetical protein
MRLRLSLTATFPYQLSLSACDLARRGGHTANRGQRSSTDNQIPKIVTLPKHMSRARSDNSQWPRIGENKPVEKWKMRTDR